MIQISIGCFKLISYFDTQQPTKAKISYTNPDLSAFLIENLVKALGVQVPIKKIGTADLAAKSDITNVKLQIEGGSTLFGEMAIADFLIGERNKTLSQAEVASGQTALRFGKDLAFDHWVYWLNTNLREAGNIKYVNLLQIGKEADKKEILKKLVKEVDEKVYPEVFVNGGRFNNQQGLLLQIMFYSYLQPVQQMVNNIFKQLLPKIRDQFGLQTFEAFRGGDQPAAGKKGVQKDITVSQSSAKIKRVNFHRNLVPQNDKRNVLITSALPYVNNVPHLGNIIGCVLSADVFARYSRLMGYNTLYICGTDEYGTATETKALEEKKTPKEICDHYHEIHKGIYEWFDCDFDHFGQITQDIFKKLHDNNFTYEQVVDQQFCTACDRFLADRFVAGTCPLCNFYDAKGDQCDGCGKLINANELINPKSTPEIRQSTHIFIDLPKIQPLHEEWFDGASVKGKWAQNAIQFTNALLKEGLKGRCITRDLKWGTPVPLESYSHKVFYVWFDAPIGYLSITANYNAENWKKWWINNDNVELYQFMGKDNITFHSVIFPCSLLGTKEPYTMLHHIATTEFLNYEVDEKTGKPKKFSKTRKTGVFGDDAIKTGIPSEVWRYYLLINRPEQQDTIFLWSDFMAKNNNELLANLGNFSNRILKFVASAYEKKVPAYPGETNAEDLAFIHSLYHEFETYIELMEGCKLKDSLRTAMHISHLCNVYMQNTKPWDLKKQNQTDRCNQVVNTALNALRFLSVIFEPFMPSFSAKVNEQLGLQRTEQDEVLLEYINGHPERILHLIKPDHVLAEPQPIFREIKQEEIEKWKKDFGGNN